MAQSSANASKVVPLKPLQKKAEAAKPSPKAPTSKTAAKKTSKSKAKKKTTIKKAAVKKTTSKKTPVKKVTAKKAVLKKTATKKAAPKKATPKKVAPQKSAVKAKKAIKKAAPKKVARKAIPKKTMKKAIKKTTTAKRQTAKSKPSIAAFTNQPTPQKPTQKEMENIMTHSQNQFDQFTKEATNASKESVDAFVKSGTIFAKGMEAIIRETMGFAQNAAEKQAQFAKEAMSVKTINEFSDVQNKIAQANFDDFMSGATKITELGTKVLSEAIEPINNQVTKTVQQATDAVAAE